MLTTTAGSSKRGMTEEGEQTETHIFHIRGERPTDAALRIGNADIS